MAVPAEILNAFHLRLFHWAEREWADEIQTRFRRLSSIPSVECEAFLSVLTTLSLDRLAILTRALNKSRPIGPKAVVGDLMGGVSAKERGEIELFRKAGWTRMSARQLIGKGGAWTSARARRRVLRKAVREALQDLAGECEEFGGDDEWRYRRIVGRWTVYTHIDISDRQQQLIYHHTIRSGEDASLMSLVESVSLMSWLGIMGSTHWNTLPTGHEHEAAAVLRGLCEHFLAAQPALLEGL